jgi:hypothetical protein
MITWTYLCIVKAFITTVDKSNNVRMLGTSFGIFKHRKSVGMIRMKFHASNYTRGSRDNYSRSG